MVGKRSEHVPHVIGRCRVCREIMWSSRRIVRVVDGVYRWPVHPECAGQIPGRAGGGEPKGPSIVEHLRGGRS